MTSTDKFAHIRAATESAMALYEYAQRCEELHKQAGQPLPPPIQALITAIVGDETPTRLTPVKAKLNRRPITPPFPVLQEGWISILVTNALPQTVIPTILSESEFAMDYRALALRVQALGTDVSEGGVMNACARLAKDKIDHTVGGWVLKEGAQTALMKEGRLFGPPELFQLQEIATYRREVILVLLGAYGALTRAQIIQILKGTTWLSAPVAMAHVKKDLTKLSESGLIRRTPGADEERTWTWELTAPTSKGKPKLRIAR